MIQDTDTTTGASAAAVEPPSGRAKPCASKRAKSKAKQTTAKAAKSQSPGAPPPCKGPPALTPEALGAGAAHVLSDEDRKFLEDRETVIEEGFKSFVLVGRALLEIREYGGGRLWRAQYGSFEAYCRTRWGFDRQYGYRLMDAARVIGELKLSPRGDTLPEPTCEAQVRPVAMLADPDDRARAWEMTVEQHGPDPLGRQVGATVRRMLKEGAKPRTERPTEPRRERMPPGASRKDMANAADSLPPEPQVEHACDPPAETAGPVSEASFLQQLDALERMMAELRDPDISLSPGCIKRSKEFSRALARFIEAVEKIARKRERDARQGKLPLDGGGADEGATP